MFVFLFVSVFLLWILDFYLKYNETTRALRKLPMPKENFLVGNGMEMILPPEKIFELGRHYANKFKDIYCWWSTVIRTVNVYTPENIEAVIATTKNSEKSIIYKMITPWLREGLLVSKGAKWQHRRKILTPAFHFNILKRFFLVMEENSKRLVEILVNTQGEAVDVIPILSEYTLSTICETAMGTKLQDQASDAGNIYKTAVKKLSQIVVERMSKVYYFPDIVFNLSSIGRKAVKQLKTLTTFTERIIRERKIFIETQGIEFSDSIDDDEEDLYLVSKKKKTAMLDLMISAEKDGIIDGPGIQEEVDTFMFEGHDTTAAGLNFCLMLLANHKDIQDKLIQEIDQLYGGSSRNTTLEDLNELKYLECCIKESMRLYPPVPFIGRKLNESLVLSGFTIPAGIECHIHIYDLHRREDLYKDSLKFDPNRFLPENSIGRHPYAYLPFSAGPRNCIGQRFAMLEMKSCILAILRKFELQPVTRPEDLKFIADLVLRSSKPVYVKFVQRV